MALYRAAPVFDVTVEAYQWRPLDDPFLSAPNAVLFDLASSLSSEFSALSHSVWVCIPHKERKILPQTSSGSIQVLHAVTLVTLYVYSHFLVT